jgi:hypothetical protein
MSEPVSKLDAVFQVGRAFRVREGMLRLNYELQRGSGLLSWRMRSVQGWNSWTLDRIAPGTDPEELLARRRHGPPQFFFPDPRLLAPSLRKILGPEGEASLLAEAESILQGKLPFFGALSFDCGFPPRWFHNPVTGQRVSPQQPWTQMRFASPLYGDLKFILEPSRFLFVYPLVRAYALTGDERFPRAFWNAVEDWANQNPPMSGPLWICGQESSLRILAWSFALHGFLHSPSTTSRRVAALISMIAAHSWRTAQTLGYARSQRSNHLISEAVGLWTAGTLYPELREAKLWQNLGAHLLHQAVLDQITSHGVSQQHSFNYQRMILHLLLWTLRLSEIHQAPLHQDIRHRTQAAFNFLRFWIDPVSGFLPNYGSDDGSLILPLSQSSYPDFRPLLQLGAAVLGHPALPSGPWDEAALWFQTEPASPEKSEPAAPPSIDTGYFRLGDDTSWAMIRAGRYTRRPFQADQLHVDLWWKGINLARDAGTYLYNGPAPWNNSLAGTSVHNTITVDGRDQMRRAGRFLWLDWAQASGRVYSSRQDGQVDCFAGEHDGYRRFGVTHRRAVRWLPGCGWVIVDDVEGTGIHHLRLHWLAPDLPLEVADAPFQVVFHTGFSKIRWNIFSSAEASSAVIRAGKPIHESAPTNSLPHLSETETQILGWYAPTYGDLQPAISLLCRTQSKLPAKFVTVILTNPQTCLDSTDGGILISHPDHKNAHAIKLRLPDRP